MQHWIHNIAEFISLLIAIFYYPYLKRSFMKWFVPFLGFIFFSELFAKYQIFILKEHTLKTYYAVFLIETLFYSYLFYSLCSESIIRKIILYVTSVAILIYVISFWMFDNYVDAFYFNLTIQGFALSFVSLTYLYSYVTNFEKTILINEPGFWLAFGVTIFFSVSTISMALHDIIIKSHVVFLGRKLHNIISQILSIFLYSSISIAIILCKKKARISSLPS